MPKKIFLVLFLIAVFVGPMFVLARIGVGVGIGKIQVDEPLKAGVIYDLPALSVLNTGDEPGEYGASIEYHEGQEQNPEMGLRPQKEWFSFEPQSFHLEPGQIQNVRIILTLPTKVQPGNYFAYLEGHPVKKSETGQTSIGVAAAAKLYFTVAPANIFQGIYYRVVSFWAMYSPWTWVVLGIILTVIVIVFFRKRFAFQVGIKKK